MLPVDSLVLDVIFKASASPQPQQLVEALGGEVVSTRKILDPDMQDPRFEMELSPSLPFRRRGERRLMIIDDSVAPMREDPRADPIVPIDLREEKKRLIAVCKTGMVRLGRINALGSWGDAVMVAESARDLRAIALLMWVLDPNMDVSGKRRASRLSQAEFEEKVMAYDKRLEELSDDEILAHLGPVNFSRDEDLLIIDVLENDGTWDVRKSIGMEDALAAIDRFSLIPGAPSQPKPGGKPVAPAKPGTKSTAGAAAKPAAPAEPPPPPEPPKVVGPPLKAIEVGDDLVLIFPRERFDLDVAAAIGKRDWDGVLAANDLNAEQRDRVFRRGAQFVAPLEFLSEVFYDGKPLSKPVFASEGKTVGAAQVLEVHCPRFGPVLLLDLGARGRFISSMIERPSAVVELLP